MAGSRRCIEGSSSMTGLCARTGEQMVVLHIALRIARTAPSLKASSCGRGVPARRHLRGQDSQGHQAGDLPVEQRTKFELVIHLKTANALDSTIPQSLLVPHSRVVLRT